MFKCHVYRIGYGADKAVASDHWRLGGAGAVDLAKAVVEACDEPCTPRFVKITEVIIFSCISFFY